MRNMQRFRSSITWCRQINRILQPNGTSRYPRASREWETSYVLHSLVKRPSALRARRTKEKNERYIRDEHAEHQDIFSPRTIRASLCYPRNLTRWNMYFLPPWGSLRYPRNRVLSPSKTSKQPQDNWIVTKDQTLPRKISKQIWRKTKLCNSKIASRRWTLSR